MEEPETKIRIKLRSYNVRMLDETCTKILDASKVTKSTPSGPVPLPTKKRVFCLLRSPHVNKDSREHFEIRTHCRLIDIFEPSEETMKNLRNLDLSAGVDVEIKSL